MITHLSAFFDHPWSPVELVIFSLLAILLGLGLGLCANTVIDTVLRSVQQRRAIPVDDARRRQLIALVKGRVS